MLCVGTALPKVRHVDQSTSEKTSYLSDAAFYAHVRVHENSREAEDPYGAVSDDADDDDCVRGDGTVDAGDGRDPRADSAEATAPRRRCSPFAVPAASDAEAIVDDLYRPLSGRRDCHSWRCRRRLAPQSLVVTHRLWNCNSIGGC